VRVEAEAILDHTHTFLKYTIINMGNKIRQKRKKLEEGVGAGSG
jgi:hypothetical protein